MSKKIPFSVRFIETLQSRAAEVESRDIPLALTAATRCAAGLDQIMGEPEFAQLKGTILKLVRIADKRQDPLSYVSTKVVVKLVSTLYALSVGQVSQLDNYTRTIGQNLCKLSDMTNKSNYVSLCKSIEYDPLDRVQAVNRAPGRGYTVGTASSQAGQVRQLLRILGIVDSVKGKRDDVMTLLDNARAARFAALFGRKLSEVDTVPDTEPQPSGDEPDSNEPDSDMLSGDETVNRDALPEVE